LLALQTVDDRLGESEQPFQSVDIASDKKGREIFHGLKENKSAGVRAALQLIVPANFFNPANPMPNRVMKEDGTSQEAGIHKDDVSHH